MTVDPVVFHPDEGGQPPDWGTIGRADVLNVEIVDGRIVHELSEPLCDGKYTAIVDREHRLHTAGHHTAQHIISGIAESRFDLETTGVHIGLERSTIDFARKTDWRTIQAIERQTMDVVAENILVESVFDDGDIRSRFDLSQVDSDTIRVVRIGKYDASACCGAHVPRTGGIGVVRIVDFESKKDGTRIYFSAGQKAVEFSQAETSVLRELRKLCGCSTTELPAIVQKALEQSRSLSRQMDRLQDVTLGTLAESAPIFEVGSTKIGIQIDAASKKYAGKLAALIAERIDGTGVAVSDCNIAISSRTLNAGEALQRLLKVVGGEGGGSPRAANGRLSRAVTCDEIIEIVSEF